MQPAEDQAPGQEPSRNDLIVALRTLLQAHGSLLTTLSQWGHIPEAMLKDDWVVMREAEKVITALK